jgi:predicted Fe-Mo cluster-binding NifX family protein
MRDEGAALVPLQALPSINPWKEVFAMPANSVPNKTTALALNQKVIEGVDTYFAKVKSLTLAGTTYTPKTLQAVLQAEIDANKAADEGKAQYRQQVVAAQAARSKGRAARKGLKAYVLGNYGAAAVQMLENLGITVPKALGVRTAKSKAEAVEKATATRTAHKEAIASVDAPAPSAPAPATANVTPLKS